jgi:prepilin peptidase CpaA
MSFQLGLPGVWLPLSSILLLMVVLIPAAISDYREQKVPNWLTMSGWVVAPLVAGMFAGFVGVGNSLLGLGLMLVLMLPLWLIHWFGAADVKLIGTVGAFVGLDDSLLVLFGILLTGLVMAVFLLLKKWLLIAASRVLSEKRGMDVRDGARESVELPYAVPIAFGTMFSLLYLQLG